VLVPKSFADTPMPAILCEKIEQSVAALLGVFSRPVSRPGPGIHKTAIIDPTVVIGDSPSIGPHVVIDIGVRIGARSVIHSGVFIGRDTVLGDDCEIWPNAVIRDGCALGSRLVIHSCAVIGGDGFGYYFDGKQHIKIPHVGGVIIEDDVEIGACACVDRAKFGNTIIGQGTKIDNQVQIAHNCRVGRHNVIAGQTGMAGSVRTGDFCVLGGRAVLFDNLSIGQHVQIGGMSVVTKDLPDGLKASGHPAQDIQTELRERAAVRRLPGYYDKIKEIIERVERLEASAHHNP
jgi:UDP-3-O-[3-hydroxymyristoyl] glucosamine N-acyltransferase